MASKLDIDVSGVPDGTYKTILTNPVDDSVVFASDVGYVSGIATTGTITPDVGTSLTGFLIDNLATHLNGAVIYGVTVSTGVITSKVFINLESTASAYYELDTPWTATGDFEIEVDFLISTATTFNMILGKSGDSSNWFGVVNGGKIQLVIGGSTATETALSYDDGVLHTLNVKRTGSTITTTIDGSIAAPNATKTNTLSWDFIGAWNSGNLNFNGILSDVKLIDITTPANSLVFGLDNLTGNTEINNGVTLTYQNIATTVDVRDTYTVSGVDWVGSELVTNGDFATSGDWLDLTGATHVISSNQITVTTTTSPAGSYQVLPTVTGAGYITEGDSINQASDLVLRISNGTTGGNSLAGAVMVDNAASFEFTAISSNSTIYLRNTSVGTNVWTRASTKRLIEVAP